MKKKIICVLGMHRSGTSLVSSLINKLGVFWGQKKEHIETNRENPDGYYELNYIIDIHEKLLDLCQSSWDSCKWIDSFYFLNKNIEVYKNAIVDYIRNIYEKFNIVYFGFKDPRTSILLPIWKQVFKELNMEPIYIWVIRNPEEVANSLLKRNKYRKKYGYQLWNYYNVKILVDLQGEKCQIVFYDDVMNKTSMICSQMHNFIFENTKIFNEDEINGIVKRKYRHSVEKKELFEESEVTTFIMQYIKQLINKNGSIMTLPISKKIDYLYTIFIKESKCYLEESELVTNKYKEALLVKTYKSYYNLLSYWIQQDNITEIILRYLKQNKYKSVIVYGIGTWGKLLLNVLKKANILVEYIIDEYQSTQINIYDGISVFNINEALFTADNNQSLIIITPYTETIPISQRLKEHGILNESISLDKLILEV